MSRSSLLLGVAGFDGKLKFLNPVWENILGYPPQELLNRPLRELLQDAGHADATELVERLLTGSYDAIEFAMRCRDGTCRWFLWQRRFDSEHEVVYIAGHDITEKKSREDASMLQSQEV
jgi:PAS domain S-box-containing protein